MEQKNTKIVLFMTMLFCLEFVQGRPDLQDAIKNEVKVFQELGTGFCTLQRFTELDQAAVQCMKQKQAEFQSGIGPDHVQVFWKHKGQIISKFIASY